MKSLNVQLASSIIKTKLNMSVGVDYFVSVTACNYVNLCTKRSSPSFKVDNTPPVVIDKPLVFSIHQDNTTSQKIISDPSFFKVFWKFRDSESPIIKTTLTIHSNLDSHMPVNDIFISNEGEFVVQLTEKNILRQGDIYILFGLRHAMLHRCVHQLLVTNFWLTQHHHKWVDFDHHWNMK